MSSDQEKSSCRIATTMSTASASSPVHGTDGNSQPARLLYVDDEPINLNIFTLTFNDEFHISTADSGEEALRILEKIKDIACIISDQRMGGMSGTELLSKVRKISPRTIRMILSAWQDTDTLLEAVNDGFIYRYILKPWNVIELRPILRQATEKYFLRGERDRLMKTLEEQNAILTRQTQELGETNAALRAIILKSLDDREDWINKFLAAQWQRIQPLLDALRASPLDKQQRRAVSLLEQRMAVSPASSPSNVEESEFALSRMENEIAALVRMGRTTKEIAELLDLSPRTVEGHRFRLRTKLGLNGQRKKLHELL